jgi:competence protein ComEC
LGRPDEGENLAHARGPRGGAPSFGTDLWPALTARLREWAHAEAGAGRLLPWVPVAFGAGIAFYFTAEHEPVARVAHGVLAKPISSVALKGFVETREERQRTDRFVLRVEQSDNSRVPIKIERVRLSVKKVTAPNVGSFVELKARLLSPLSPLRPGSYDFGRDMYFQGIGASGFAMGAIKATDPPHDGGLALGYAAMMQNFRDAIDARIRRSLSGDNGTA